LTTSILIPVNDSISSHTMLGFFINLFIDRDNVDITLLHIFRKPSASEELMGEEYMKEKQPARMLALLEKTKAKFIKSGFNPENIRVRLSTDPYPTITDGIIDQFKEENYDMIVIGRKQMSKAEEFVLGDISTKLMRTLEGVAILVVKSI